ncbi:WapI family immunity protein [Nonomuraea bangladeshensis]
MIGRSRESDHLLIPVLGRSFPGSADPWDASWLRTPVHVRAGGFTADLDARLRLPELRAFRTELERVHERVEGTAVLSSLEHWIELSVECRPTGALAVSGTVRDDPSSGNTLSFEIEGLDQTDLPPLVAALLAVEERFPL